MMKNEMESWLGVELSIEDFDIINKCYIYMNTLFQNRGYLVEYYGLVGMDGMRALYGELMAHQAEVKELKDEILNNEDTIARLENINKNAEQSYKELEASINKHGTSGTQQKVADEKLKDSSASIQMCISTLKDLNESFSSGLLSKLISELSSVQGTLNSLVGD